PGVVRANGVQGRSRRRDDPRTGRAVPVVPQVSSPVAVADQTEVTFPVTGMTCASCVRRIEKALGRVDGVHNASVNLATEKAQVVFDPAIASMDQMRAAVQKAGYSIGELP